MNRRSFLRTAAAGGASAFLLPTLRAARTLVEPPIEGSRESLLLYIDQLPGGSPAPGATLASGPRKIKKSAKVPRKAKDLSVAAAERKLSKLRQPR